jgi:hypothetical protein
MVGRGVILRLVLPALLLAALVPADAAADLIRLFGEENAGTAGAQFLRVPAGARAVALGKAYVAMATDGAAPLWNPAGIMRTPGRKNFFASHTEYTAGIDLHHMAYHMRGQNFGYAVLAGVLRSGDILRTTELHQQGTGQYFNANQFFVGASLARAMTDRFSIGGTLKFYQENLDEYRIDALLADLGILYYVGLGDLRVGFAVRNFGSDLKTGGTPPALADGWQPAKEFQSFPAPTVGTFGAAKSWRLSRRLGLVTSTDFNHPSDNRESFRMGTELGMNDMLFLRGGYETSREEGGLAAGFGLQLRRKQFLLRIDYAYSDQGTFGVIHHVSVDLSPLMRPRDPQAWRRRGARR